MTTRPPTLLFVDDEPSILKALRRLFIDEPWTLLFATSGAEGLRLLETEAVDLVVSDFRMPEMDGATFLAQVKARHPEVVRIFLSGYADKQSVTQALAEGCAQQILPKPWEDQQLRQVLDEALRQSARQREQNASLQRLINSIPQLPSLPATYVEIRNCFADRERLSVDRVAAIVAQDPALTLSLLHWANSALFGQMHRVDTVKRAIVVLGTDIVEGLFLATVLKKTMEGVTTPVPGFDLQRFQAHAGACAVLARLLAWQLAMPTPEKADRAFTAGLLHDIGKLVEARFFPDQLALALERARQKTTTLYAEERSLWGVSHSDIGGFLAEWWGLPDFITNAVRWHHEPDRGWLDREMADIIHVANRLTGYYLAEAGEMPALDDLRRARYGLTAERLEDWRSRVEEAMRTAAD